MIALLQRVSQAHVDVEQNTIARIERGLLVFVGVQKQDDATRAERMIDRILHYRVFADNHGRMNLDLRAVAGGLLLVPQFTLAADTGSGTRPGFSVAATPEQGKKIFQHMVSSARQAYPEVAAGEFGARMQVNLCNDGPVTFILDT